MMIAGASSKVTILTGGRWNRPSHSGLVSLRGVAEFGADEVGFFDGPRNGATDGAYQRWGSRSLRDRRGIGRQGGLSGAFLSKTGVTEAVSAFFEKAEGVEDFMWVFGMTDGEHGFEAERALASGEGG